MMRKKKNKTAQIKKPMWWPVNSAARFLQIIENDNTAHPQPVCYTLSARTLYTLSLHIAQPQLAPGVSTKSIQS